MKKDPQHNLRPNILIIMSDDQGPWAMNCAGTPELITPTLDRLASEGIRLANCFCVSPVCSPARASFLTGTIPSRHGIHDWLRSGNIDVEDGVTWSGRDRPIEYLAGLTGFTDILAANGYICGFSGKWHLGASGTPQKGHTYWCTHSLGGADYTDYYAFDNTPEMEHQTQYVTDFFTDRAIRFLDRHGSGDAPFCLSVHYTAPHSPWKQREQPPEVWHRYDNCDFASMPVQPPHPWGGWDPKPEDRRKTIQGYFTTITAMDAAIARILDRLDTLGIADNTLVFFSGDNGFNMGHHGIVGKGNGTFPLNMYEESVKIPFMARWPGHIPAGAVNEDLVSHYDFMPTLLECVGLKNHTPSGLPGQSFAGILEGRNGGSDSVVVFDEYGPVRMIREREWKYIHRYPQGPHELYCLAEDPGEKYNRIDEPDYREHAQRLREEMDEWFKLHLEPDRDGANLPVSGKGQIDLVGISGACRKAFT